MAAAATSAVMRLVLSPNPESGGVMTVGGGCSGASTTGEVGLRRGKGSGAMGNDVEGGFIHDPDLDRWRGEEGRGERVGGAWVRWARVSHRWGCYGD